ncbi:hypothetical protein [Rhodanobacter sp. FW106-PBR-LB-2-11]|uniref:hypothetical protein n=1 Tax=Rhodanobacter sp. FW106-PBR-LB-2-11 TaxID=1524463 RepID=UPI0034E56497
MSTQATTVIRRLWNANRFGFLMTVGYVAFGLYSLATGAIAYFDPAPQLPGVDPLIGPGFLIVAGIAGTAMGAIFLYRMVALELTVIRFDAAPRGEQNAMLARELGLPVSEIEAMRSRRGTQDQR